MMSCKCNLNTSKSIKTQEIINLLDCPENGTCTIKILKNKSLNILKDNTEAIYYQLSENNSKSVVHFKYDKNKIENTSDSSHIEEIIFEINNNENNLDIENKKLQETKMLFGRHCFCREKSGYFTVVDGRLKISSENEKTFYELIFSINETPQLFSEIRFYQK